MKYTASHIALEVSIRDAQTGQALPEVLIGSQLTITAEPGRDFSVHILAAGPCFAWEGCISAVCKIGAGSYSESALLQPHTPACIRGWRTPTGGRAFRMAEIEEVEDDGLAGAQAGALGPNTLQVFVTRVYGDFIPHNQNLGAGLTPQVHSKDDSKKWFQRPSLDCVEGNPFAVHGYVGHYTGNQSLATLTAVLETLTYVELRQKELQRKLQQQQDQQRRSQLLIADKPYVPRADELQTIVGRNGEEIVVLD